VLAIGLTLWWKWVPALLPPAALTRIDPFEPATTTRFLVLGGAAVLTAAGAALTFVRGSSAVDLWWTGIVVFGLATAAGAMRQNAPGIAIAEGGRASETLLWMLAAGGVCLTLIAHRPDADDAFFVNVAVSAADAPAHAVLSGDTLHGVQGFPLNLPVYRVHSYELLNGALSYLAGIPAIYVFHWIAAALSALLVPLAHAKIFRILTPRRWLESVASLVFVLIAVGEIHRWHGNFAFVRMWQGKGPFLFVFMPLVYAYALRFARCPNLRDWMLLGAAQIAAVGCSSTALWVAPVGAVLALLVGAMGPLRQITKTVALGALASLYVLGAAWVIKTSLVGPFAIGVQGPRSTEAGGLMREALLAVFGDSRLLFVAIVVLLAGWMFAPAGLARRFAVIIPLIVWLTILNPYLAAWVRVHVTGPTYWRSLWAVPMPILMALILISPLSRSGRAAWFRGPAWLVLLAAFALFVPRFSAVSPENGVRLSWPTLKVQEPAYHWAAVINETVPPGSAVAVPAPVDEWIPTFHHPAYPLIVRTYLFPLEGRLSGEEVQARSAMRQFLGAPELIAATPQPFRDGLERFAVRAALMVSSPQAGTARTILEQAGFRRTRSDEPYELWLRPEPKSNR
jgi:Family of unknown function (DUF6077)